MSETSVTPLHFLDLEAGGTSQILTESTNSAKAVASSPSGE